MASTNAILGAAIASVLGALALTLVVGPALFPVKYPEHPGFAPDISALQTAGSGPAVAEGPPDFGKVFGDPAQLAALTTRGENLVGQCKSCHTLGDGEPNRIGPNLHDVFGRHSATHPGFDYSDAMKAHNVDWSYLTLNDFLTSPGQVVRGTKMTFAGIRNTNDRMAVIAYLSSISPHHEALPAPLPAAPAAGTATGTGTSTTTGTSTSTAVNPPTTTAPAQNAAPRGGAGGAPHMIDD